MDKTLNTIHVIFLQGQYQRMRRIEALLRHGSFKTPSGALMSFKDQVCHCTGPLTSVAKMVDADHFVGFSAAGSFIMSMRTGAIDWMERNDDGFELELEVLPYAEAAPLLKLAGFQGQP